MDFTKARLLKHDFPAHGCNLSYLVVVPESLKEPSQFELKNALVMKKPFLGVVGKCCRGALLETGSQDSVATWVPRIGVKDGLKAAIIAICLGFWGPFKPCFYALKSSNKSHRIAKQFLRHYRLGCCERVLRFIGREVQGRQNFRMQAVKWMVAKLQGDKLLLSAENEWSRSYRVINQHASLPWNFITH